MNSENIKDLRDQIDALDDQIVELLLKRIHLSNAIIKAKKPGQIVDPQREQDIHRRYSERLGLASTPPKVKYLVAAVLAVSSLYPTRRSPSET